MAFIAEHNGIRRHVTFSRKGEIVLSEADLIGKPRQVIGTAVKEGNEYRVVSAEFSEIYALGPNREIAVREMMNRVERERSARAEETQVVQSFQFREIASARQDHPDNAAYLKELVEHFQPRNMWDAIKEGNIENLSVDDLKALLLINRLGTSYNSDHEHFLTEIIRLRRIVE